MDPRLRKITMKRIEELIQQMGEISKELVSLAEEAYKTHKKISTPLVASFRKVHRAIQILEVDVLNRPSVERQQELKEVSGYREDIEEHHESYGMVSVSRITGSQRLVGAMADNLPQMIEIKVQRARRIIDPTLYIERFYGESMPVMTIRMSSYQFAELITNLNTTGIPCTIENILGVQMDPVPEQALTPLEQLVKNVKKSTRYDESQIEKDYAKSLDDLAAKVSESGLSKKKAEEINTMVRELKRLVTAPKSTAAWASQRVAEATEEALAQGRVEMAAALQTALIQSGLKSLGDGLQVPQLTPGEKA